MWNYSWLKVIISDFDFLSQVHTMHLRICIQYWFVFRNPGRGGGLIVNREKGNDPSSLLDCGLYSEREVWGA